MPWISKLELRKPDGPRRRTETSSRSFYWTARRPHPAPVDDRTFARRAYLDIWGLLPLPAQLTAVRRLNTTPDKRARLVASLLSNDRNYAENWISFWNDLLRNDEGVNYAGTRKSITPWLYDALRGEHAV